MTRLDLIGIHSQRARNDGISLTFKFDRAAQVNHHNILTGVELLLQLFGRDAGDAQLANETLAFKVLPGNVGHERPDD